MFTALEEHDDMGSLNKNMTEMIQQNAEHSKTNKETEKAENIIAYKIFDEES